MTRSSRMPKSSVKLRLAKFLIFIVFIWALIFPFLTPFIDDVVETLKEEKQKIVPKVVEKPLHNVVLPKFSAIVDVKEKKRQFFSFIKPEVIKENDRILQLRAKISTLRDSLALEMPLVLADAQLIAKLVKEFRVSKKFSQLRQLDELLIKVDVIPPPLVLVQAANESAWGTSRFARIGLNFFGIWCYKPGCGMVPSGRNIGAKHEVEAFDSVASAVRRYLHNINTNNAYIVFRTIRSQLREQDQPLSAEILATGLLPYSERGTDYVLEITEMIRHNQDYF